MTVSPRPNPKRIALELNVPEKDVAMMNRRMAYSDKSLNAAMRDEDGGERLDGLADDRACRRVA